MKRVNRKISAGKSTSTFMHLRYQTPNLIFSFVFLLFIEIFVQYVILFVNY